LACRLMRIMIEFWRLRQLTCQCHPAASSRCFVPTRSLSELKVGLPPDPDHDRTLATAAVNVSMPFRPLRRFSPDQLNGRDRGQAR
jgi:hypothetical protein